MLMTDIGKRIKERRKELGLSMEEISQIVGKDRSTFYRYEKGDIEKMPVSILVSLADALQTTVGYLLGIEEKTSNEKNQFIDLILKLSSDDNFYDLVLNISKLDSNQLTAIKQMISAFQK